MRVFIPGGAGYVGSLLVPELLNAGYEVIVYDLFIYGEDVFDSIKNHPNLKLVKGDVRDLHHMEIALNGGCDFVIHLVNMPSDQSMQSSSNLGRSINLDPFEPFVGIAKRRKVKRFIYTSSTSVYGLKASENLVEDMDINPQTDDAKFKAAFEEALMRHQDNDFTCCILRPATICGYAPRQRLDVVVNILTNLAFNTGKIKVMGGEQLNPTVHIKDMVRAYLQILEAPIEKIKGEIFNVGYHNHSLLELGNMVQSTVGKKKSVDLETIPANCDASTHISSKKISEKLGFTPKYSIEDAVDSLVEAFESGKLPNPLDDKRYFNMETIKAVNFQ